MTTPAPPQVDLHEEALGGINAAIDRMTLGAGRAPEEARRPAARLPPAFGVLLACHDATVASARVTEWARHLGEMHGARVVVASVAPPLHRYYEGLPGVAGYWNTMFEVYKDVERSHREAARSAADLLRLDGIDAEAVTTTGSVAHELAEVAKTMRADLVILGAHGGPLRRVLLGSVAEAVASRVPASILVARTPPRPSRILAATDGSAAAGLAVAHALRIASATGAELVVQHVLETPGRPEDVPPDGFLKGVVEKMSLPAPPRVRYVLDVGRPADAIARRAEQEGCGLIVMGTRGLGRVAGALLGSVSHRVANSAPVSVLLVRDADA